MTDLTKKIDELAEIKKEQAKLKERQSVIEAEITKQATTDLENTKYKTIYYTAANAGVKATNAESLKIVYSSFLPLVFGTAYKDAVTEKQDYKISAAAARMMIGLWKGNYIKATIADVVNQMTGVTDDERKQLIKKLKGVNYDICKAGYMTDTGAWQANALQELGVLHSDILSSVAQYSGQSEETLKKLFEDAAVTATEYDNEIYRKNGLNPQSVKVSASQMQILEAGYKKTNGNLSNLTRTTAVTSQTSFINACSLAELKTTSGAFTYEQAITDAVKQIAADGAFVMYPSGHRDRIDVAVRRNVMTGLGQTTGEICLANANDLGCDLMEITAHCGARPSHAQWQGQIVSLSGRRGYLSLSDIGYGTGDGFKGWNCRHDWFPYFEGSTRVYSAKDLKELNAKNIVYPDGSLHTQYEAEQYQRMCERKIRETKRILSACDEAYNNLSDDKLLRLLNKDISKYSQKLSWQNAQLKLFCEKTNLIVDSSRTRVYGFGKSQAQKAISRNKRELAKYTKYHYNKDGTILITDDWTDKKANNTPKKYKPYAVIETKTVYKNGIEQIDRNFYNKNSMLVLQVHSSNHNKPQSHPYGRNGEHSHDFSWNKDGSKIINRSTREVSDNERKVNSDLL